MKLLSHLVILGLLAFIAPSYSYEPRTGAVALYYGELVFIVGGRTVAPMCQCAEDYTSLSAHVDVLDPVNGDFETAVDFPSMNHGRAFHSAVIYDGTIYVWGGAGENTDVEVFDGQWHIVETMDDNKAWTHIGDRPSARHSHGTVVSGTRMYIFGGIEVSSGNALNDMWYFDIEHRVWVQHQPHGIIPSPRAGFAFEIIDDDAYLFGGFDTQAEANYFNQVWKFDPLTGEWNHLSTENGPSARAYAAVVADEEGLFIFGGRAPNANLSGVFEYYGDSWSIATSGEATHFPVQEGAQRPVPRAMAARVIFEDGRSMIISGANEQREPLADTWLSYGRYDLEDTLYENFWQRSCFPGYQFPRCLMDCSEVDWCSGNGVCMGNQTCCCDAGYSGNNCSENPCDNHLGFNTDLINQILLPKSLESTYHKLESIVEKLRTVRELLPSSEVNQVNMTDIAEESYNFYQSCLVHDLCENTQCFEDLVGCDAPCGAETFCVVDDICISNQCVHGHARDCSENFKDNKCVNSWCDEENGCMHSTVTCDDDNLCTVDHCDPQLGCVHEQITCNDFDCCTTDMCSHTDGKCYYTDKCADRNPCTTDQCTDECEWGQCGYEYDSECYMSAGQNPYTEECERGSPRTIGRPLILSAGDAVPSSDYPVTANAFFWLRADSCELIYEITLNDLDAAEYETGAHIFGNALAGENAGVVYTFNSGPVKIGKWNFCEMEATNVAESLLDGQFYVQMYFGGMGSIRSQIYFQETIEGQDPECFV